MGHLGLGRGECACGGCGWQALWRVVCGGGARQGARHQGGGIVMIAGIAALVAAYVLSQFYRAFLAVLTGLWGGFCSRGIGRGPRR